MQANYARAVTALLDAGADVDADPDSSSRYGRRALQAAAHCGSGAAVNARGGGGIYATALQAAAAADDVLRSDAAVQRCILLLAHGADVDCGKGHGRKRGQRGLAAGPRAAGGGRRRK